MDVSTATQKTKVIIIGGGPTGLSMAVQLLRYNIDFVVLEKNEKTTPLSKAIAVQARSLEIFSEIGLAEKAVKEGRITTGLNLFYKGRQRAAVNFSGLGTGLSPFPFALSLEQSKTEKLLLDYLADHGKTIKWKSEFIRLEQNEKGVAAYYKDDAGQAQKIEASYLVGCDGAGSLVRHQLDLPFKGDTVPKIFYVADVKLKSAVINKNELFFFLIKKGFILFFPMEGEGHYRIVGILPGAKEADEHFKFEDLENDIKQQIVSPVNFEEVRWFSSYKVHSRMTDSFIKGRCYIAGDASHIHTPAGGQGMNTGIQDAYNLAWKMAYVIRGELKPDILKTYDIERVENARHLLQTTDRLFELMAGTTGFMNYIRLNFFPQIMHWITQYSLVRRRVFPLLSETGIIYPPSDLTIKSSIGKVKSGIRIPYFKFSDGKQIFDYVKQPVFKLLFFGNSNDNTNDKLTTIKIKVILHTFKEIPKSLFGSKKDFYILLRADNHISYIGKDLSTCIDMLSGLQADGPNFYS